MDTYVSRFISITSLGIGACVAFAAVFFFFASPVDTSQQASGASASKAYTEMAREHVTQTYNLRKAVEFYRKAVALDSSNASALYELVRAYTVLGSYERAQANAGRYMDRFPNDTKILYTAALNAGFSGDYVKAEELFSQYITKNTESKWQSRLDLAWAQYQQGNYLEAQKVIATAIEAFGDNAWLNTSKAAIEHALGNNEAALTAITAAEEEVSEIDANTWNQNYAFNGPDHFEKGIEQMKKIIAINKAIIVGGKAPTFTRADFSKMAGFAPEEGKGIVVSACGETCGPQICNSPANACGATQQWSINTCDTPSVTCATNPLPPPPVPERYGQSCTSINLCGIQATGTVQCDGRCSALAPLPPAFGQGCTIRNRCGSANGTVGCNGQCNVARYPTCTTNPDDDGVIGGDDGWTEVIINPDDRFPGQGYGNIGLKINAFPNLVKAGQRAIVRWNSIEMSSCTVTGTNGDRWSGLQGEEITRPITLRTTYTLTCTAFDGRTMSDVAVIGIVPVMCEIGQAGCEQM
ncbi:MAG: hypothetical protein RI911_522 [Candidatus Parcubacteria bacterium]|jgi:tetratricopeptide (TPR) repeat protein